MNFGGRFFAHDHVPRSGFGELRRSSHAAYAHFEWRLQSGEMRLSNGIPSACARAWTEASVGTLWHCSMLMIVFLERWLASPSLSKDHPRARR